MYCTCESLVWQTPASIYLLQESALFLSVIPLTILTDTWPKPNSLPFADFILRVIFTNSPWAFELLPLLNHGYSQQSQILFLPFSILHNPFNAAVKNLQVCILTVFFIIIIRFSTWRSLFFCLLFKELTLLLLTNPDAHYFTCSIFLMNVNPAAHWS